MFDIRADFGLYSGIFTLLVLFGIAYNALAAWMERRGYMEGYVSLIVALGMLVTLIPFIIFDLPVITVLGGFICTGTPMIVGSISRYLQERERAQRELARLNHYDDKNENLAK